MSAVPDYPAHWEADVLLVDGRAAHIRPTRPADGDLLREFYGRVSAQSQYLRFFQPHPNLSEDEIRRFTHADNRTEVNLVTTLAGRIVGIGNYVSEDFPAAEVAFLVEDRLQGLGIGPLLLEHLAQCGRERGIRRFTADVLPENRRMIEIFRVAGYEIKGWAEGGVVYLEFPIDPTDTAVGVSRAREHRAEALSMRRFLVAESVAVIGAGRSPQSLGHQVLLNIVAGGFTGRVYAVNPHIDTVASMPAYASVTDIDDSIDLAVISVPTDQVFEVVRECAAARVGSLVVFSSGFADAGPEGRTRQEDLLRLVRSEGMRMVGPNCVGFINVADEHRLNASLSPLLPAHGGLGFFCQSGALALVILEAIIERGLGLSTFVAAGNRADVSGNDLLQYWEDDPDTECILLYLESIGNPRKFFRIARRIAREKPIIAVRGGRWSQASPLGHVPAPDPVPQEAIDAMFAQAGIVTVGNTDQLLDVAHLITTQPLPRGPRVAVVGNSDALGLLMVDAVITGGLSVGSTTFLGAGTSAEEFAGALQAALADDQIDIVVVVYLPLRPAQGVGVLETLGRVTTGATKPVVSLVVRAPTMLGDRPESHPSTAIPVYRTPEQAVVCLTRALAHSRVVSSPLGERPVFPDLAEREARDWVEERLRAHPEGLELTDDEARTLLEFYGIDVLASTPVASLSQCQAAAASYGWPVVLRATATDLRSRPDIQHAWTTIESIQEMAMAWAELSQLTEDPAEARFVVQRMGVTGVPVVVTATEDRFFGPIVSLGLSGISSDLHRDLTYRIPPLIGGDALEMIEELKVAPLFHGYRDGPRADVTRLEALIHRVAQLKDALPEADYVQLGRVLVGAERTEVVRASIRLAPADGSRSNWYTRRLSGPAPVRP